MAELFICKIASLQEMDIKWEYEIAQSGKDRENWIIWKKQAMENYRQGYTIPYYGVLEGSIICEATAMVHPKVVQNSTGLVGSHTVYLSAFRTTSRFQGKGYFSKLFHFMIDDLQHKGYTKATLGVEPADVKNKERYAHYGFTEYIKSGKEYYPDGTAIDVEYYGKNIGISQ